MYVIRRRILFNNKCEPGSNGCLNRRPVKDSVHVQPVPEVSELEWTVPRKTASRNVVSALVHHDVPIENAYSTLFISDPCLNMLVILIISHN